MCDRAFRSVPIYEGVTEVLKLIISRKMVKAAVTNRNQAYAPCKDSVRLAGSV